MNGKLDRLEFGDGACIMEVDGWKNQFLIGNDTLIAIALEYSGPSRVEYLQKWYNQNKAAPIAVEFWMEGEVTDAINHVTEARFKVT